MRWTPIGVVGLLFTISCSCYSGEGQPAKERPPTPANVVNEPPRPDLPAPAPAWTEELIEIRRQLGGGALKGSLLESPSSAEAAPAEFLSELQRLSIEPPLKSSPVASTEFRSHPRGVRPDYPDSELIDSLRRTAWLLDDRANRLEFGEDYANAQRYRKLAQRLRREARNVTAADE